MSFGSGIESRIPRYFFWLRYHSYVLCLSVCGLETLIRSRADGFGTVCLTFVTKSLAPTYQRNFCRNSFAKNSVSSDRLLQHETASIPCRFRTRQSGSVKSFGRRWAYESPGEGTREPQSTAMQVSQEITKISVTTALLKSTKRDRSFPSERWLVLCPSRHDMAKRKSRLRYS